MLALDHHLALACAVYVLFNCMIWSFTTKLDELATLSAGKLTK